MNLKDLVRKASSTLVVGMLAMAAFAQGRTVSGVVTDEFGEPLPGVNVVVKGTTNGVITDFDGNYSLQDVNNNDVLEFSFVGFTPKQIKVDANAKFDIQMFEDQQNLEEVVVVGYGTVSKKDLTGAVTSIKAKDIAAVPVTSASEALTGKMAGVNVTTTEGSPDADVKIRVRGGGSLSQDNSPLYIVDGFPVASISDIAPSEIESIDVLKDASSTAIYGARGANGVIIVTTKSGKEGKTQVSFNASYGWKQATRLQKVLSPYEYAYYQYEIASATQSAGFVSGYGSFDDLEIWRSVEGRDYQDELFGRTGNQVQYNANISGGTKDMKYNISYAHSDENAIMRKSGFRKDNVAAKINANLNEWLSLDFNARLAYQVIDGLSSGTEQEGNASNSIVGQAIRFAPINVLSSGDEDEENSTSQRVDPSTRLDATYKVQRRFRQDYNAGINWKPFEGWTFRSEFGYGWRYYNTDQVYEELAARYNTKIGYTTAPQAQFTTKDYRNWRNANTVTYDNKKLFGKRDHINVMIGQEWSSSNEVDRVHTSVNFPSSLTVDEILANTAISTALPNESDIKADDNMLSFFDRINYTMMQKYLLTVTVRADGSSKFGEGHRWGAFPSVALAWRLSDEEWMQSTASWLSNLKLRLSYGTAGNNRITSGLLKTTYSMAGNSGKHPGFNEVNTPMMEHGTYLANPNLNWETTVTRNFGIDYGFFNGRLSGNFEVYWNTTKDLLMRAKVPSSSGYSYQYQNFGQTSNKGVEFAINAAAVESKNFTLNFNFNIAYNKSNIDELNSDNPYQTSSFAGSAINYTDGDFRVAEGGSLGEVWGFKSAGFYSTNDITFDGSKWVLKDGVNNNSYTYFGTLYPGTPKLEADGEGKAVFQKLGNTVPTITGGFGIDGRYRWFDYAVFCNYSLGNQIVNGSKLVASFFQGSQQHYNLVDDFSIANGRYTWIDPATGLNLGRPSRSTISAYGGTDGLINRLAEINSGASCYNPAAASTSVITSDAVEDASFLRLQNVTLGFTFPKKWVKVAFLESVRIYCTGYNLMCWTPYSGNDPEVDTNSNPMCPGIDFAAYPRSRSWVAGINVTF